MEKQTNKKNEEEEEFLCGTILFQAMSREMEELKKGGYSKIGYVIRVFKVLRKYMRKM